MLKIFDEVVTNATDAALRDSTVTRLHINVCHQTGAIRVYNDGNGIMAAPWTGAIPEGQAATTGDLYNITVLFARYRSGTNLGSGGGGGAAIQGGRNGFGVSLTNTFSSEFTVLTGCPGNGDRPGTLFRQTWRDNLNVEEVPKVRKFKQKSGFVDVTFVPDWNKLGVAAPGPDGLDQNLLYALTRRAADAAICSTLRKLKVTLTTLPREQAAQVATSGAPQLPKGIKALPICGGTQYIQLLLRHAPGGAAVVKPACEVVSLQGEGAAAGLKVLEVAACYVSAEQATWLQTYDGLHIGFVNGFRCSAGSHMEHAWSRIIGVVRERIEAKLKRKEGAAARIRPESIKQQIALCVVCLVENKSFESQSKHVLKTPFKNLGFNWLPDAKGSFANTLCGTGLIDTLISSLESREAAGEKKTVGRRNTTLLDKYDPPVGRTTDDKSLMVVEGDSAKAFVVAGLSAKGVGREHYGIFALRGKLMNSRKAKLHEVQSNKELSALTQILGLTPGTEYTLEMARKLPYQHLVLVCDQDLDGSHIAGLVVCTYIYPLYIPPMTTYLDGGNPAGELASRSFLEPPSRQARLCPALLHSHRPGAAQGRGRTQLLHTSKLPRVG